VKLYVWESLIHGRYFNQIKKLQGLKNNFKADIVQLDVNTVRTLITCRIDRRQETYG